MSRLSGLIAQLAALGYHYDPATGLASPVGRQARAKTMDARKAYQAGLILEQIYAARDAGFGRATRRAQARDRDNARRWPG